MNEELSLHIASEEDARLVDAARTVSGKQVTDRLVPYGNIGELLDTQADTYGEKIWLIHYPDNGPREEYSYCEFLQLVRKTAYLLHHRGLRRGDRICTVGYNHSDTVIQYFAAWYLGLVVVPINTGEDDQRISYIIRNSQARLAFVRGRYYDRIMNLRHEFPELEQIEIVGPLDGETTPSFTDGLHDLDAEFVPSQQPGLSDDALVVYTSGTTGQPKGVVLDHYNLLVDAKGITDWHAMDDSQRMMCVLPIHHVNGTVVTLMTPLYFGGSIVLNRKFHSHTFFERIAEEKVHIASVVPTLLQFLLHEDIDCSGFDLSHFRHIICGAGPLTCELSQKFEDRYAIPIMHGYGLSETTCYSCFLPVDLIEEQHRQWLQKYGFPSIGVPIATNEMGIHDPEGNSMGEGERGEIVIRGHNVMKYYYKNPEANSSTFAHGWFRSGDEGFYRTDELGRSFFFITGRLKELIIRGGVNIAPLELDEVINTCPGVKSGIAVGFENDWYGEEVGALVQKSDPDLTEEDVFQHCRKLLPFSKSPKVVLFSDEIPVTSTGKYQRNKVKHLFAEWKGEQFR